MPSFTLFGMSKTPTPEYLKSLKNCIMSQTSRMDLPEQITVTPPAIFLRLCREYYEVSPSELISALAYEFCLSPPQNLILVEREAASAKSLSRQEAA